MLYDNGSIELKIIRYPGICGSVSPCRACAYLTLCRSVIKPNHTKKHCEYVPSYQNTKHDLAADFHTYGRAENTCPEDIMKRWNAMIWHNSWDCQTRCAIGQISIVQHKPLGCRSVNHTVNSNSYNMFSCLLYGENVHFIYHTDRFIYKGMNLDERHRGKNIGLLWEYNYHNLQLGGAIKLCCLQKRKFYVKKN